LTGESFCAPNSEGHDFAWQWTKNHLSTWPCFWAYR
jgi:hypothetical protein